MPGLLKTRLLGLTAALCVSFAVVSPAAAQDVLSAPEVQQAVQTEERILIDIRSQAEWEETGLAAGSFPVSIHDPQFGANLSALFQKFGPDRIAMICATGGRTAYVANVLKANGITGVADVSEGMFGNGTAPGWIERGLPTVSLAEAEAAYASAMAN